MGIAGRVLTSGINCTTVTLQVTTVVSRTLLLHHNKLLFIIVILQHSQTNRRVSPTAASAVTHVTHTHTHTHTRSTLSLNTRQ